jgi:hypothetical protein
MQPYYNQFYPDATDTRWTQLIVDSNIAAKYGVAPASDWVRSGGQLQPPPSNPGNDVPYNTMHRDFWLPYLKANYYERYMALDPQPVSDTWTDFSTGDATPVPTSMNQAWFRIYRELPSDHDNDGTPYYDRVPLSGFGVFVIAAGSGGTRGFRYWNSSDPGFSRDVEPVTAQESGLFTNDESLFRELQRSQRVLWFRVEWSASSSAELSVSQQVIGQTNKADPSMALMTGLNSNLGSTSQNEGESKYLYQTGITRRYFGTFTWVQRLEREPPKW